MGSEYNSVSGLARVLDNPRWPIARACAAVANCLEMSRDNFRPFFEQTFPLLLRRVFGYDGASWLTTLAHGGKEADISALLDLLSPTGKLFAAMHAVDADALVRYHFPTERLPTHTQVLLNSAAGRTVLASWPQYSGGAVGVDATGRPHVHLNVFRYFLAWFAFYVLRGGLADGGIGAPSQRPGGYIGSLNPGQFTGSVLKAAGSLGLTRCPGGGSGGNPFFRLLRLYLQHFLPRPVPGAPTLQRHSGGSAAGGSAGEVFYSVLVEWWLTDGEEPLPLPSVTGVHPAVQGPAGSSALGATQPLRSLTYEAPSNELLQALTVLVRYATVFDDPSTAAAGSGGPVGTAAALRPAQGVAAWLPLPPVASAPPGAAGKQSWRPPPRLGAAGSPAAQALARRVFRLLKRALSFWPEQRSVEAVFTLWLALLAPWHAPDAPGWSKGPQQQEQGGGGGVAHHLSRAGSVVLQAGSLRRGSTDLRNAHGGAVRTSYDASVWQTHVLAHLPVYGVLVPLAAEAAAARVRARGQEPAATLLKVLQVFHAAPELTDMLEAVEEAASRFGGFGGGFTPSAATPRRRPEGPFAELLPWAGEQVADWEAAASAGSQLPDAWSGRAQDVPPELSMFATDARGAAPWVAAVIRTSEGAAPAQLLEALRTAAAAVLPLDRVVAAEQQAPPAVVPSAQGAQTQGLRRGHWSQLKYRGDPLRRPIASYELAPLARLAVRASEAANARLRLGQPIADDEAAADGIVQSAVLFARRRNWRVNLRPLAEWRTLAFALAVWVGLRWIVWPLLRLMWLIATTPLDDDFGGGQQQQQQYSHSAQYDSHSQGYREF